MFGTRIVSFDRARDPLLSIRGRGYGKFDSGEIVKMAPTKVPRLIGKRGAMINMISEKTGADVKVGQNGIVVVNGSPEGIMKAVKAIKLVDEEAYGPDLMPKVEESLGGEGSGGS